MKDFYLYVGAYGSKLISLLFLVHCVEFFGPSMNILTEWKYILSIQVVVSMAGILQYKFLRGLAGKFLNETFLLTLTITAIVDFVLGLVIIFKEILISHEFLGAMLVISIVTFSLVALISVFLFFKERFLGI